MLSTIPEMRLMVDLHMGVCFLAEPNNDSPLNIHAAELWDNQAMYKKVLLEKYAKDVKNV